MYKVLAIKCNSKLFGRVVRMEFEHSHSPQSAFHSQLHYFCANIASHRGSSLEH